MQNENQNSWERISEQLDGLESIPDETPLDAGAVWTGVQGRLYPAKKKIAIWWAAAALLIFSGTTLFFHYASRHDAIEMTRNNNKSAVKKTAPSGPVLPETGSSSSISADENTLTPGAETPSERRLLPATSDRFSVATGKSDSRNIQHHRAQLVSSHISSSVPVTGSGQLNPAGSASFSPAAKTDSINTVAAVAIRKPLPVIHLNDLEEPGFPETGTDNAVKNNPVSTRSRFPIGVFTGPSATSANAGLATPRNSFFRINLER